MKCADVEAIIKHVEGILWEVGPGYTKVEIEAMHSRPIPQKSTPKPKAIPACRGTRYNGEE